MTEESSNQNIFEEAEKGVSKYAKRASARSGSFISSKEETVSAPEGIGAEASSVQGEETQPEINLTGEETPAVDVPHEENAAETGGEKGASGGEETSSAANNPGEQENQSLSGEPEEITDEKIKAVLKEYEDLVNLTEKGLKEEFVAEGGEQLKTLSEEFNRSIDRYNDNIRIIPGFLDKKQEIEKIFEQVFEIENNKDEKRMAEAFDLLQKANKLMDEIVGSSKKETSAEKYLREKRFKETEERYKLLNDRFEREGKGLLGEANKEVVLSWLGKVRYFLNRAQEFNNDENNDRCLRYLGEANKFLDGVGGLLGEPLKESAKITSQTVKDALDKLNIDARELEAELPDFCGLTEGQQMLALENLNQLRLGLIEEQALLKYEEDTSKMTFAVAARKWWRRDYGKKLHVWKNLGEKSGDLLEGGKAALKSGFKNITLAREKRRQIEEIKQGGLGILKDDLTAIIKEIKANNIEASLNRKNALQVNYFSVSKLENLIDFSKYDEKYKESAETKVQDLNTASLRLSKMPFEWSKSRKKTERDKYNKASKEYECVRSEFLRLMGEENKGAAFKYLNEAEYAVEMNKFLNENPDAEGAIKNIESGRFWLSAISSTAAERGYMAGLGFAGRMAAGAAVGFVGMPLVAGAIGAFTAIKRGNELFEEKTKTSRRGKESFLKEYEIGILKRRIEILGEYLQKNLDLKKEEKEKIESEIFSYKERIKFINSYFRSAPVDLEGNEIKEFKEKHIIFEKAEVLNESLDDLLKDYFDALLKLDAEEEKNKILKSLRNLTEYIERNINEGLIDFGGRAGSVGRQYELLRNLALARSVSGFLDEGVKEEIDLRLRRVFAERKSVVSEVKRRFIRNKMITGVATSAGFALGGAAIRHFFFEGPSQKEVDLDTTTDKNGGADTLEEINKFLEEKNRKLNELDEFLKQKDRELNPDKRSSLYIPFLSTREAFADFKSRFEQLNPDVQRKILDISNKTSPKTREDIYVKGYKGEKGDDAVFNYFYDEYEKKFGVKTKGTEFSPSVPKVSKITGERLTFENANEYIDDWIERMKQVKEENSAANISYTMLSTPGNRKIVLDILQGKLKYKGRIGQEAAVDWVLDRKNQFSKTMPESALEAASSVGGGAKPETSAPVPEAIPSPQGTVRPATPLVSESAPSAEGTKAVPPPKAPPASSAPSEVVPPPKPPTPIESTPKVSEAPLQIKAEIKEGGDVWSSAFSLIGKGEGKISADQFNEAWNNPRSGAMVNGEFIGIKDINLTHKNDELIFIPAKGGEPAKFEVLDFKGDKYKMGHRDMLEKPQVQREIRTGLTEAEKKFGVKQEAGVPRDDRVEFSNPGNVFGKEEGALLTTVVEKEKTLDFSAYKEYFSKQGEEGVIFSEKDVKEIADTLGYDINNSDASKNLPKDLVEKIANNPEIFKDEKGGWLRDRLRFAASNTEMPIEKQEKVFSFQDIVNINLNKDFSADEIYRRFYGDDVWINTNEEGISILKGGEKFYINDSGTITLLRANGQTIDSLLIPDTIIKKNIDLNEFTVSDLEKISDGIREKYGQEIAIYKDLDNSRKVLTKNLDETQLKGVLVSKISDVLSKDWPKKFGGNIFTGKENSAANVREFLNTQVEYLRGKKIGDINLEADLGKMGVGEFLSKYSSDLVERVNKI